MKLSVAIPCYEMNGRGSEMLQYSFEVLKRQNFQDFEVVVSDHSVDDNVRDVCNRESKYLNIGYFRNAKKRGSSSANINNAIVNCTGQLIKILCQDDFLYGNDAIEKTINKFDYTKKWLVSGYLHTRDRINFDTHHVPKLSSRIYLENHIGTHSCLTILNDDPILFDENLIWFMDSEYYYRLYKRYGAPLIMSEPTMAQYLWQGQVTNTIITDEIIKSEEKYIASKYEYRKIIMKISNIFLKLKKKFGIKQDIKGGVEVAEKYFSERKITARDVREHLDTLRSYALKADHITELGVRTIVTTWPFILGRPRQLVSIDIKHPSDYLKDGGHLLNVVKHVCDEMGIDFKFVLGDTLKIDLEKTDLLFIDTLHTYSQLIQELNRHGNKSRKWIILHDTEACKDYFKNSVGVIEGGLKDAIDEFLANNNQWFTKDVFTNNNGLTVLERRDEIETI